MFINDEAQRQILPVIAKATVAPTSSDAQQRAGALLQLNPGQQVKAEIIANLPNSLYLARVAGEMYHLEIPLNVQPGETMDMTFVAAEPRITFQVLPQAQNSASVSLSSIGKWLSLLSSDVSSLAAPGETLVENPAQGTSLLAGRLRGVLTQGGLFYESHLALWTAGQLQLADLLKEPQGKLSRHASEGGSDDADGDADGKDAGFADSRTLPIVKEQLKLLNSGVLCWQGEAWPGQGMEISIGERTDPEGEPAVEAALSIALPDLGGVEAMIRFGKDGLVVELACEKPESSALLREGGDELRAALITAGLHLKRLAVKNGESTQ